MKYIGIDIGKRKCDYCVLDDGGQVVERGQYQNTRDGTRGFAADMAAKYGRDGCKAACETTANMWRMTHNAFEEAGIHIELANTFQMSIISKTAKKTDKVDAEKIAHVLRMDMIPKCYVPRIGLQALRNMVRQHTKLVQTRTQEVNRIHSMLDTEGRDQGSGTLHSNSGLEYLEGQTLATKQDTEILYQRCRHIRHLNEELDMLDADITAEAADNEYAQILVSMTGVGVYSALLLAAEIANINRFPSPKHLVSWAGLCPTVHQSGDKKFYGRMKKLNTARQVNWIMCEVANTAAMHDVKMKAVYEEARRRHADKHALAIPVVGNKMLTIMWHMLKTMSPYETRNVQLYARKLAQMSKARR